MMIFPKKLHSRFPGKKFFTIDIGVSRDEDQFSHSVISRKMERKELFRPVPSSTLAAAYKGLKSRLTVKCSLMIRYCCRNTVHWLILIIKVSKIFYHISPRRLFVH